MTGLERLDEALADYENAVHKSEVVWDQKTIVAAARAYRDLLANGERVWRCDEHNADFLEKSPDEYSMCMAMLYENAWDALPEPEPCRPVRVVGVHPTIGEET